MNGCHTRREVIAESPICQIEQCSCGTLHLTIGPLTLRLDQKAVASIWGALGDALHHVAGGESHGGWGNKTSEAQPS